MNDLSLVQAKTGTGKTVALLLPTIQNTLMQPRGAEAGNIRALTGMITGLSSSDAAF